MEVYRKKYEQALERAKKYLYDTNKRMSTEFFKATERAFMEVFPELKDDKIRKWLIEMVSELRKVNSTNANHNGMCSDAIAWLEKQGEQKPNFCHHEVDLSDCSEEYRKAYYDGWNNCNQQHSQLKAEQKPT